MARFAARRHPNLLRTAAAIAVAVASTALADEVRFKNGDKLTGTVLSAEGGKLKVKTAVAGEVVVDMADVATFTTDAPIEVRTKTNEIINAPAAAATTQGAVSVAKAGSAAQDVPLDSVKYINFDQAWSGAIIGNALFARGNTYADQAGLAFDATRRTLDDRWTFDGAYNFGRQKDPTTGDKITSIDNFFAAGKYDYFFTEKFYGYGSFRYDHDRIADLDRRLTPSVGVGYQWFDEADFKFNTEAGIAYVSEKFENGDTNDALSLRLAYHLTKDLWDDKVTLFHNLEYFPSLETLNDYLILTDAGVRTALTDKMFMEYKVELRYDATPATGLDRKDYRHVIGVGWRF